MNQLEAGTYLLPINMFSKPTIFLSYTRKDHAKVKQLYQKLLEAGFHPWMDTEDILPGEDWKQCLMRTIREAPFFIACLTKNAANKRGVIQEELREALDVWRQKLNSDIYLIPIKLEDCEVPETLANFQWLNFYETKGFEKLIEALQTGIQRLGAASSPHVQIRMRSPRMTTFIAYQKRLSESKQFRSDLENIIRSRSDLTGIEVIDGRVPAGVGLASAIRDRMKKASLVVADVTGLSSEVVFELGFAYGLRKAIMPVASKSSDIPKLPSWLGTTQLGTYENRVGLLSLCSGIAAHYLDPEYAKPPRPAQPIPALAVWVRELSWNKHALEQFKAVATRESLKTEVFSNVSDDEKVIRRVASATLLIVSLDGSEADSLVHFICGAIVAKPKAGYGGTLSRQVLILQEPTENKVTLAAESLMRCHSTVQSVALGEIREATEKFARHYNNLAQKTID